MEWTPDKPVKRGWCANNITGFGDEEDTLVAPGVTNARVEKRGRKKCSDKTKT